MIPSNSRLHFLAAQLLLLFVLFFFTHSASAQEIIRTLNHPHTVYWVDISDNGKHIYTAGKDTIGRIWNRTGQELIQLIGHDHSISSILRIEKAKLVITGAYDNTAAIWDHKGKLLHRLSGHTNGVINLAVSEKDKMICTVSRDKTARLWGFKGKAVAILEGHTGQVNYALFIPEKKQVVTGSFDGNIHFWDYTGTLLMSFTPPNDSGIRLLALSPDGRYIYAGHRDGTITKSSIEGEFIRTIQAHGDMISQILFRRNGEIITSSMGPHIKLWTGDFELIDSWKAHDSYVSGIALYKDILVSSSGDQTVRVWKLK